MSNDASESTGKLWSRDAAKEKATPPTPERAAGNVLPLRPDRDRAYVAFEVREHTQRLHIHCAAHPSRYPAYSSLLDIIHDHDFDRVFTLAYSFMVVEVTGNRLRSIVHASASAIASAFTSFTASSMTRPRRTSPSSNRLRLPPSLRNSGLSYAGRLKEPS
jgi:hypothetical protein